MIGGWYDDGWAEDLESWEELADLLRGDWDRVAHPSLGLSLERADGLLAFDLRGRWHARHRRGLHRLGFRALALGGVDVWKWDVEPQLHATDLSRFASPFESIFGAERSVAGAATVVRLRTSLARDYLAAIISFMAAHRPSPSTAPAAAPAARSPRPRRHDEDDDEDDEQQQHQKWGEVRQATDCSYS